MKTYRVAIMDCKGVLKYYFVLAENRIAASKEAEATFKAYNHKPCRVWAVMGG